MFNKVKFGEVIRQRRKKDNSTMLSFSEKFNISESYLGRIERGELSPSIDITVTMLNYCYLSFEDINNIADDTTQVNNDFLKQYPIDFSEVDYKFLYESLLCFLSFYGGGENHV